jgi:hypothetical protein
MGRGRIALGVLRGMMDNMSKRKERDNRKEGAEKVEASAKDTLGSGPTVSGSPVTSISPSQSWTWQTGMSPHDSLERSWAEKIKGAAVLSFSDGMETLTKRMVKRLREREEMDIRVGERAEVKAVRSDEGTGGLEVSTGTVN